MTYPRIGQAKPALFAQDGYQFRRRQGGIAAAGQGQERQRNVFPPQSVGGGRLLE